MAGEPEPTGVRAPLGHLGQALRTIHLRAREQVSASTWVVAALALVVVMGPLLVFAGIAEEVVEREPLGFDEPILQALHALQTPWLTEAMRAVTSLGGVVVVPVIALLAAAWLWLARGRLRPAVFLTLALLGSTAINTTGKTLFARQRPDLWTHLVTETSFSFPSGHAMASATLGLCLVALAWPTRHRVSVSVAAGTYVLVIGTSRVYLGVHYPSDILAGWSLSFVWVAIVVVAMWWGNRDHAEHQAGA